jgi:hypothetical protein
MKAKLLICFIMLIGVVAATTGNNTTVCYLWITTNDGNYIVGVYQNDTGKFEAMLSSQVSVRFEDTWYFNFMPLGKRFADLNNSITINLEKAQPCTHTETLYS